MRGIWSTLFAVLTKKNSQDDAPPTFEWPLVSKFSVYHHPVDGWAAVKQGFSWPALVLGIFWALFNRLWSIAFALLGVSIGIQLLELLLLESVGLGGTALLLLAQLGVGVYVGQRGNHWLRARLLSQDYLFERELEAPSQAKAVSMVRADALGAELDTLVRNRVDKVAP